MITSPGVTSCDGQPPSAAGSLLLGGCLPVVELLHRKAGFRLMLVGRPRKLPLRRPSAAAP